MVFLFGKMVFWMALSLWFMMKWLESSRFMVLLFVALKKREPIKQFWSLESKYGFLEQTHKVVKNSHLNSNKQTSSWVEGHFHLITEPTSHHTKSSHSLINKAEESNKYQN